MMNIHFENLLIDTANGVATVTINRPQSRNAITPKMREQLVRIFEATADDPDIRVIVLKGAQGHFISGGDKDAFAETLDMAQEDRAQNFESRAMEAARLIEAMTASPKIIVSAVEGAVAGAGIAIAFASDFVVASRSAKFAFAHVRAGLAMDLGLSYFLPRLCGPLTAKRLALLGDVISAEEAARFGMVSNLAEDGDVDRALDDVLARLLKLPAPALAAAKCQLNASYDNDLRTQLALEAKVLGETAGTDEFESLLTQFASRSKAS